MAFYFPKPPGASLLPGVRQPRLLEVCRADNHYLDMPRVMHLHEDRCEMLFIVAGKARHIIGNRHYDLRPGQLVIYNAGVLHEEYIDASDDMLVYCIALGDLQLPGLPPNHILEPPGCPVIETGDHRHFVEQNFRMIYDQIASESDPGYVLAHHLTMALVSFVLTLARPELPNADAETESNGRAIKGWLDAHYREDIALQDISRALYLSPFYISHVFKAYSGYSPMQYVTRRRIGEAQSRLVNTKDSISAIAADVGYNSSSLFSRMFNLYVGRSPARYRKDYQKSPRD